MRVIKRHRMWLLVVSRRLRQVSWLGLLNCLNFLSSSKRVISWSCTAATLRSSHLGYWLSPCLIWVRTLSWRVSCKAKHVSQIFSELASAGNASTCNARPVGTRILQISSCCSTLVHYTKLSIFNCIMGEAWWVWCWSCRNNTGVWNAGKMLSTL